ncbi:MAG: META domain-containing protein [Rhodospirillaceae bacterium]|nr:META domain-containing protein [Rhodospirillaceae bacterium]
MNRLLCSYSLALLLLAFAGASVVAADEDAGRIVCSGNEPFWRLEAAQGSALLTRPGDSEPVERTYSGALVVLDWLDPGWLVWRGSAIDDASDVLVATMRAEQCIDSMAGDEGDAFDHRVLLSLPQEPALAGCCRVGLPPQEAAAEAASDDMPAVKPETDWSRYLPDLLPALQRCLFDAPVVIDRVVAAWPMNHGMAGVRAIDEEGAAHDCIASMDGGKIDMFDRAGDAMPGEGDPAFHPVRDQPPAIDSGRLEQVIDGEGALVGWLHYAASEPIEGGRLATDPTAVYEASWVVADIEGIGPIEGTDVSIQFNPLGTLSGHAGCNRFSGNAELGEGVVKIGPLASTKMACADPITDQELRFLDALTRAQAWRLEGGLLYFDAADGAPLLRFAAAE